MNEPRSDTQEKRPIGRKLGTRDLLRSLEGDRLYYAASIARIQVDPKEDKKAYNRLKKSLTAYRSYHFRDEPAHGKVDGFDAWKGEFWKAHIKEPDQAPISEAELDISETKDPIKSLSVPKENISLDIISHPHKTPFQTNRKKPLLFFSLSALCICAIAWLLLSPSQEEKGNSKIHFAGNLPVLPAFTTGVEPPVF